VGMNEASGAVLGGLCGPAGMTGSVNLANVILNGTCQVGREKRQVTLVLMPADDFRLIGEATADNGAKARIELPLS
jgi:hypothetical protein